jgi:hypothetical protein
MIYDYHINYYFALFYILYVIIRIFHLLYYHNVNIFYLSRMNKAFDL